jgi:hypothetical protein
MTLGRGTDLRVRYNVVIGVVNLVRAWLSLRGSGAVSLSAILGILFPLLGVTQLTRVYFELDTATCAISVKAFLGFTRRFGVRTAACSTSTATT